MMNRFLRIAGLLAQIFLSVFLLIVLVRSIFAAAFTGPRSFSVPVDSKEMLITYFLPALFHIVISLAGSISWYFLDTSPNDVEKKTLPLLLLVLTLTNIKILPLHTAFTGALVLSFSFVARVYLFSLLFGNFLLLAVGLFEQGFNTIKLGQSFIVGASVSLLISLLAPISVNTVSFMTAPSLTNTTLLWVIRSLGLLGCINFVVIYFKEQTRHNLIRCGAYILFILGNMLLQTHGNLPFPLIGVVFHAVGVVLLTPLGRSYRM